jgi:hypothetical protein
VPFSVDVDLFVVVTVEEAVTVMHGVGGEEGRVLEGETLLDGGEVGTGDLGLYFADVDGLVAFVGVDLAVGDPGVVDGGHLGKVFGEFRDEVGRV